MKRDVKHQNQQLSKAKQTRNQEEEKNKAWKKHLVKFLE